MNHNILSFVRFKHENSLKEHLSTLTLAQLLHKTEELTVRLNSEKLSQELIDECEIVMDEYSKRIARNFLLPNKKKAYH